MVGAFQSCCANEIKRFGGMVAQYLGDGVLAYFGYPAAHEDDAERAVRAGLAILDMVGTLKPAPGVTLQARIGVASGVVVVGDLVREGVTQENAAIGETTNQAARLQSLAEPNTIVISPETHRLVGALFEYRDLGHHSLKGFADAGARASGAQREQFGKPVRGAPTSGVAVARPRRGARSPRAALATGQDRRRARRADQPASQGLGSRASRERCWSGCRHEPHTRLQYHCSPHHQGSALHPVISQLVRAAGIGHDGRPRSKAGQA